MSTLLRARCSGNAPLAPPSDGSWPAIAGLILAVAQHQLQIVATRKAIGRNRRRAARRKRWGQR